MGTQPAGHELATLPTLPRVAVVDAKVRVPAWEVVGEVYCALADVVEDEMTTAALLAK
jgi:hypothetical protein